MGRERKRGKQINRVREREKSSKGVSVWREREGKGEVNCKKFVQLAPGPTQAFIWVKCDRVVKKQTRSK